MPNIKYDVAVTKLMSELAKAEKSAKEKGLLSEEEADKIIASETLMQELVKAKTSAQKHGWLTQEEVEKELEFI